MKELTFQKAENVNILYESTDISLESDSVTFINMTLQFKFNQNVWS